MKGRSASACDVKGTQIGKGLRKGQGKFGQTSQSSTGNIIDLSMKENYSYVWYYVIIVKVIQAVIKNVMMTDVAKCKWIIINEMIKWIC